MHGDVGSGEHNANKLWTHARTHVASTYKHMRAGPLACSLQPGAHGATQTCQSPSELFKPLQFRLISKIYEFGSEQITHPLISTLSLSQPASEGRGVSVDDNGGCRTGQSKAVVASGSRAEGHRFSQRPSGLFPEVCPWRKVKQKPNRTPPPPPAMRAQDWSEREKHKF